MELDRASVQEVAPSQFPANSPAPRLMLISRMSLRFAAIQSRAATKSLMEPKPEPSRARMTKILAFGATPTEETTPSEVTIPATLVPCPFPSSAAPAPDWRLVPFGQQPP